MMNDNTIRVEGMNALVGKLGEVNAEKFITLIKKDKFDYTKWQETLFAGKGAEEINQDAKDYYKNKYPDEMK